ncbi:MULTISPECIES: hypothetical protein [unclassified Sphingobium]|uniref:hypothetical protein n=1 Tax=unclassified Sphingobium TaxID=2611147 RepID=UPI002225449D|nr:MULTISPECIES: hypothetical protein [unclassified Sphingobium]MCW2395890.1 hypothetical protein [Sphingobium sp. B8D3B]MCW2419406.1 hypothetical protein [Sphingobium sp. B8D3C]
MTSSTAAGSTLAITATAPATFDAAGYEAGTFTKVGGVEKIGGVGSVFNKVEFQPLDGPKDKHKGSRDNGSLSPSMALDETDAGQVLMRTAADDKTSKIYYFKVTFPTGAKRYFGGRVFGMPENIDGADSILMANPTVEIITDIVRVPAS